MEESGWVTQGTAQWHFCTLHALGQQLRRKHDTRVETAPLSGIPCVAGTLAALCLSLLYVCL